MPQASSSAHKRVTAVVNPAAANEDAKTYTDTINWYNPMPSAPTRLLTYILKKMPSDRNRREVTVIIAAFFTKTRFCMKSPRFGDIGDKVSVVKQGD